MKKTFLVFTLSLVFVFSGLHAINISAGQTIMEDFDSIGTSATATLPTDWKADKNNSVRTVGSYSAAGTATERIGGNDMSGSAANGIYNLGAGVAGSASDRAIGGISSGSASKSVNVYIKLTNNGSTAINSFDISYNVEKYRDGTNAAGFSIEMYYSTDGENWISAGNDFKSSFAGGDAANAGFASAPGATISVSNKNLAQALAVNADLYLAWNYSVTSGPTTSNAQSLAVDDISITAVGGAPQPSITVNPATLSDFSYVEGSGPSSAQTFTVSGSELTGNISLTAPTHYEISTTEVSGYTSSLSLTQVSGSVDETTIYVRLKDDLNAGYYNDENIVAISSGASNQSVVCNGRVYKTEPSNHVGSFTLGDVTSYSITLNWTDAVGTVVPDAYIIKGSDVGFAEIEDPVDGITEQWDTLVHTVAQGIQTYTFSNLDAQTTYYFKIFPYSNNGAAIDYKIDGVVPQVSGMTDAIEWPEDFEVGSKTGYAGGYVICKMGEWYMEQALLGDAVGDMKIDDQSVRLRYDSGTTTYGSVTSNFQKHNGLGTISLYYSRANFSGDKTGNSPKFVVEYSSDKENWIQAGEETDLDGVDELTLFSAEVNVYGSYYIRVRQTDGDNGKRWNLDNINVTDFEDVNPVELNSFTATISALNYVTLTWVTQTETGMRGYYVFRAPANDLASAQIVSPMIESMNSSQQQSYVYEDRELYDSGTYYYWLQANDLDGSSAFHGPVSVVYNSMGEHSTPEIPLVTELHSVYPNPFNPLVFIPFSLAHDGAVSFKIYNSRGQIVKHFDLGTKSAGQHRISWDGTDYNGKSLANGVYHIMMSTQDQVYKTKAALLK